MEAQTKKRDEVAFLHRSYLDVVVWRSSLCHDT